MKSLIMLMEPGEFTFLVGTRVPATRKVRLRDAVTGVREEAVDGMDSLPLTTKDLEANYRRTGKAPTGLLLWRFESGICCKKAMAKMPIAQWMVSAICCVLMWDDAAPRSHLVYSAVVMFNNVPRGTLAPGSR